MQPPRPMSTRFPYTTLFRSDGRLWAAVASSCNQCGGHFFARNPAFSISPLCIASASVSHLTNSGPVMNDWLNRSEEHTSELQSHVNLVCRLLLVKNNK